MLHCYFFKLIVRIILSIIYFTIDEITFKIFTFIVCYFNLFHRIFFSRNFTRTILRHGTIYNAIRNMYNCHQSLHRTVSHMEEHKKLFPLFQLDFQGLYVPVHLTHPSTIVKMINSRREKLSYGIHIRGGRWSISPGQVCSLS